MQQRDQGEWAVMYSTEMSVEGYAGHNLSVQAVRI